MYLILISPDLLKDVSTREEVVAKQLLIMRISFVDISMMVT